MDLESYQLRGSRVSPMTTKQISDTAKGFSRNFELKKYFRKKNLDKPLEALFTYHITLDIIDNTQWMADTLGFTSGHFDPESLTISLPERTYELACEGDKEALFIVMHEIGHLVLGHRPLLHHSRKKPTHQEDSEWQADLFADVILDTLGFNSKQLTFDFL